MFATLTEPFKAMKYLQRPWTIFRNWLNKASPESAIIIAAVQILSHGFSQECGIFLTETYRHPNH